MLLDTVHNHPESSSVPNDGVNGTVALSEELVSMPLPGSPFLLQVDLYVVVACLTICVWDWLLSLSDELEMLRHGNHWRRYFYDVLYIVVRFCPIVYLTVIMMLAEGGDNNTKTLTILRETLNIVIMPAASALFFIRLSAVYWRDKYVTAFFGSFLLAILGLFVSDSAQGVIRCLNVDQSTYCLRARPIDASGYIATAVYDTLMYFSISWQLASFATVEKWQDRLRRFFTGDGLGWLSKVLLQSGQMYYFITIGLSILVTIFIFRPAVHNGWNAMVVPPNVTIASIMACRMFRELKLGLIVGPISEGAISNLVFRDIGSIQEHDVYPL